MNLTWQWLAYGELTTDQLYDVMMLRQRVFVVEQQCVYQDADGLDRESHHLLGRDADGKLRAYLRIVAPGVKYEEPSIGRVITDPDVRGQGLGKDLMQEGLRGAARLYPGQPNRIGAQERLRRFYEELGYHAIGAPFDEDGIPHIEMLWAPVHGDRIPGIFRLNH